MPIIFERNFSGATPGPLSGFPPAAGVSWVNPNYPNPFSFDLPTVQTQSYPGDFSATGITERCTSEGYHSLWLYKQAGENPYGLVYNTKELALAGGNIVAVDGSLVFTLLPADRWFSLGVGSCYEAGPPQTILELEADNFSHVGPWLQIDGFGPPGQYVRMAVSYVYVSLGGVATHTAVDISTAGWDLFQERVIRIEWHDYVVDYYLDGTLVASVTTNRPPGPVPIFDLAAEYGSSVLYIQGAEFDSPDIVTNAYWQNKHNVAETL